MKQMLTKRAAPAWVVAVLVLTLLFPMQSFAQGRGHGQSKKAAKFINGHDARDGRWDGRGPRGRDDRDRDDRDDDDDYNGGYGRGRSRGRDRDNTGVYDRTEIRRQALSVGYDEGYRAGRNDRADGRSFDYADHNTYRDATAGYRNSYGDLEYYRSNFRTGFRQGYEDGYRNRNSRGGGRLGNVLGDILGRP